MRACHLQRLSGSHKALVEMQDDVAELLRSAAQEYASTKVRVSCFRTSPASECGGGGVWGAGGGGVTKFTSLMDFEFNRGTKTADASYRPDNFAIGLLLKPVQVSEVVHTNEDFLSRSEKICLCRKVKPPTR